MKRYIIVVFVLFACQNKTSKCSLQYISLDNIHYDIEGCLVNSLEDGNWAVYDTAHQISQTGFFRQGIRVGKWMYPQTKDSLIWNEFQDSILGIKTNIPNFLKVTWRDGFFLKMDNSDTANKLTLVLAVREDLGKSIDVDTLYKISEKEIVEKGWQYQYSRIKISSKGRVFFMNSYKLYRGQERLQTINFYGVSQNKKVVEITLTFDPLLTNKANTIFNSVVLNIFINSNRFVDPFQPIEKAQKF